MQDCNRYNMSQNYLKLISLNVERDRHLDLVRSFLISEKPDVLCIQEVMESNFEFLKKELNMDGIFKPMTKHLSVSDNVEGRSGVAILSKMKISDFEAIYYRGNEGQIKFHDKSTLANLNNTVAKVLIVAKIKYGEDCINIGTTHFTWTPDGMADDVQREDLDKLLSLLSKYKDIVFCGDFNAPRGWEIFNKIASIYKDNIPLKYDSSIDPNLHRVKNLRYMVDYLFSTKEYLIKDVELREGVSDHKAVIGYISKK